MRFATFLLICALFSGPLLAAGDSTGWAPPPPPADDFDWIQLTSGEWLKGEIKALYDDRLEFDSKELDLQTFDWDDIAQLRSGRSHSIRFTDQTTLRGRIRLKGDAVTVVSGERRQVFKRQQVLSLTQTGDSPAGLWSGKVSLGINVASGNSDQTDFSLRADAKRQTVRSRMTMNYLGLYTKADGIETINNHRLGGEYDIFATREYFWRPLFAEYYRDPFLNIEHKLTLGAGAGYHLVDTPKITWDISGGPAWQYQRFVSVEPGENREESVPVLVLGTSYEQEITGDLDFSTNYGLQLGDKRIGGYTHHWISTLEMDITSNLDFDVSLIWDRTQYPTRSSDGELPKQDDFKLIFGVGWDL